MEYTNEVLKAIYLLIRFFIIFLAFAVARHFAKESKRAHWKVYLLTFVIIIGLALLSSYTLGTHIEDSDPLYGGGETVTDYESTYEQRIKHGIFIFTVLIIPALIGSYKGLQKRNYKIQNDQEK
jgi:heme/copper-type cytochrome/quinol oxidase subunit 4